LSRNGSASESDPTRSKPCFDGREDDVGARRARHLIETAEGDPEGVRIRSLPERRSETQPQLPMRAEIFDELLPVMDEEGKRWALQVSEEI
jgi:hypothetical protein